MKVYILIAALYTGHGPAITMQEFNSLDTCEAASEIILNKFQGAFVNARVECVLK